MKTLAEIEKIKDSGAEISRTLFQPELRSMISRSQACEIGAQLYEAGLTKALELMLERERVLSDLISIAADRMLYWRTQAQGAANLIPETELCFRGEPEQLVERIKEALEKLK